MKIKNIDFFCFVVLSTVSAYNFSQYEQGGFFIFFGIFSGAMAMGCMIDGAVTVITEAINNSNKEKE